MSRGYLLYECPQYVYTVKLTKQLGHLSGSGQPHREQLPLACAVSSRYTRMCTRQYDCRARGELAASSSPRAQRSHGTSTFAPMLISRPSAEYSGSTQSSSLVFRPSSIFIAGFPSQWLKELTAWKPGYPANGREISVVRERPASSAGSNAERDTCQLF